MHCCRQRIVDHLVRCVDVVRWARVQHDAQDIADRLIHTFTDCICLWILHSGSFPICASNSWNSCPMNSPPLSWMHRFGLGYLESQLFSNCSDTCLIDFLSIQMSSERFDTGSMLVRALNSCICPLTTIVHRPMRSIHTSFHGTSAACLGGVCP